MQRFVFTVAIVFATACGGSSPTAPTPVTAAPPVAAAPAPPTPTPPPAPAEMWSRSGSGNTVFDLPASVSRLRIQGTWNQRDTSNFVVQISGRLVVNEILRTTITYDGIHLVPAGNRVVEITNSSAISWTLTQVQ
jgi:hypothetical protein